MAKAKKQEQAPSSGAAAPEGSGKKKAGGKAKSAPPVKAAAPVPRDVPLIDTNLAASTAAKSIMHKDDLTTAATASPKGESAAFKEMKGNLHKSSGQNTPNVLQNIAPGKKFNNSVPSRNQQIGRNQTFGADVNRTGVPRRTGG